mmetsp:Transcript_32301/g.75973  ORF Transcript_32301/g.75973 Transcript_32301/m.75973 type:complete len:93 (-) Transcript_32301:414-692(-)
MSVSTSFRLGLTIGEQHTIRIAFIARRSAPAIDSIVALRASGAQTRTLESNYTTMLQHHNRQAGSHMIRVGHRDAAAFNSIAVVQNSTVAGT